MTADLRRLAEQATPGPWRTFYDNYEDGTMLVGTVAEGADNIIGDDIKPDNAEYIAAANPAAILALLDGFDRANDAIGEAAKVNVAAERRAAALEGLLDRFLQLEVRDTRRGSLPLRADSFAGIAQEARALLDPAAPPADDRTPYQSPDLHTGTEHSDRVLTDDK